jgi:hypothetical protein
MTLSCHLQQAQNPLPDQQIHDRTLMHRTFVTWILPIIQTQNELLPPNRMEMKT